MSKTFFLKKRIIVAFFLYGSYVFWLAFSFYSLKDLSQGFTNFFLCFSHLYSREHNREKDTRLILYVCPPESIVWWGFKAIEACS